MTEIMIDGFMSSPCHTATLVLLLSASSHVGLGSSKIIIIMIIIIINVFIYKGYTNLAYKANLPPSSLLFTTYAETC